MLPVEAHLAYAIVRDGFALLKQPPEVQPCVCRCENVRDGCEAVERALKEHLSAPEPLRPDVIVTILLIFLCGVCVGATSACAAGAAWRLWWPLKRSVSPSSVVVPPRAIVPEPVSSDGGHLPGRRRGVLLAPRTDGLREV